LNRVGFDSKIVQENLKLWIKHDLLTEPEETSLEAYDAWKKEASSRAA